MSSSGGPEKPVHAILDTGQVRPTKDATSLQTPVTVGTSKATRTIGNKVSFLKAVPTRNVTIAPKPSTGQKILVKTLHEVKTSQSSHKQPIPLAQISRLPTTLGTKIMITPACNTPNILLHNLPAKREMPTISPVIPSMATPAQPMGQHGEAVLTPRCIPSVLKVQQNKDGSQARPLLPKIPTSQIVKPKVPLIVNEQGLNLLTKAINVQQNELPKRYATAEVPVPPSKRPRLLAPKPYISVDEKCRVCAEITMDMVGIFTTQGIKLNLAEKISLHLPIEVKKTDRLPLKVCEPCVAKLNICHELTLSCSEANQKLIHQLEEEEQMRLREAKNAANAPIPLYLIENTEADSAPPEEGPQRLHVITEKLVHVDKSLPKPEQIAQVIETVKAGLGTDHNVSLNSLYKKVVRQGAAMEQMKQGSKASDNSTAAASKSYKCFVCNDLLPNWFTLIEHQLLKFHCRTCKARFCSIKARKIHQRSTHNKGSHRCHKCNMILSTREELSQHKRIAHSLQCECCNKTFVSRVTLISHMKTQLNKEYYVCKDCGEKCNTRRKYTHHIQNNLCIFRYKGELFPCDICDKQFTSMLKLRNHEKEHLPDHPKFECPHCPKVFPSQTKLKRHSIFHVSEKPIQCTLCPKRFILKSQLKYHMEVHANIRKFECDFCGAKFLHRVHLIKHISNLHLQNTYYECVLCKASFTNRTVAEIHSETHSMDEKLRSGEHIFIKLITEHQCTICNKYLSSKYGLEKHMNCHGEKSISVICEICGKGFSNKNSLSYHYNLHKDGQMDEVRRGPKCKSSVNYSRVFGKKRYECEYCKNLYATTVALTAHVASHTGVKPFKCNFCSATFTTKLCQKNHELRHRGIKNFSCELCGKSFYNKYGLTLHMRVHTREKPYMCCYCNKTFPRKSNLTPHLRTHTGEKPYVCHVCGRSFTQKTSLDKHMCKHRQERMYKCMYCDTSYDKKRDLTQHELVVHNISTDPYVIKLNIPTEERGNNSQGDSNEIEYQIQIIESEEVHDF